jgi:hypothetical protein
MGVTHPAGTLGVPVPGSHVASTISAGGRVYQTSWTSPVGVSQPGIIAVDNVTGTVYSVNQEDPILVAFNGWTGAEERSLVLVNSSNEYSVESIAFDNISGALYLGFGDGGGPSYITVIDAATFAWITNITFAGSSNPSFEPSQELFEFNTNQLFVENQTIQTGTDDAVAINTTTNAIADWFQVDCTGATLYGGCYADYNMFEILDSFGVWIVILPDQANVSYSIVPSADIADDFVASGFVGPADFYFGPGTTWPAFNATYVVNASGNGDVDVFGNAGTSLFFAPGVLPGYPISFVEDPSTGWLGLASENFSSNQGAQFDLVNPFSVTIAAQLANTSISSEDYFSQVAPMDLPNGTTNGVGYFVTSGYNYEGPTGELIMVNDSAPYASVVLSYTPNIEPYESSLVSAVDSALGLVIEAATYSNLVFAMNDATGAIVWTAPLSDSVSITWMSLDATDGVVFLSTEDSIVSLSAATGAVDGTLAVSTYEPFAATYGFGHLLYTLDQTNETIQVYSNSGSGGSLTWEEQISLPLDTDAYSLAASPVAEVVADISYGFPNNTVQISTVSPSETVANVSGLTDGYAVAFNATGALYVGNGTDDATTGNVSVYAPMTWAPVRTIPTAMPVDYLELVPVLGALIVAGYSTPVELVNATTGHLLATFSTPGFEEFPSADAATGSFAFPGGTGETLLANLVALPSATGGLAVTPGNSTLAVHWTAATGASGYPVTGYLVYTGAAATGPWTQVGSATTATSANLTGLTDGTTYYVTVRATSGSGTGPAATSVSGVPSGVPYPPTGVAVTAPTSSTLTVGWGAPSSDGGDAITAYTVLYATSASGPWTSAPAGTQTTATLTALASGTTYYVKVEAANSAGTSNPSASAQGTTSSSSSGSTSGSGLSGSSWLWIAVAVVVVVIVVALAAMMMMRRGKSGSTTSPGGAPPSGSSTPGAPPSGASGGTPPPPPPGAQ